MLARNTVLPLMMVIVVQTCVCTAYCRRLRNPLYIYIIIIIILNIIMIIISSSTSNQSNPEESRGPTSLVAWPAHALDPGAQQDVGPGAKERGSRRLQYPLTKEYTLNHIRDPTIILRYIP